MACRKPFRWKYSRSTRVEVALCDNVNKYLVWKIEQTESLVLQTSNNALKIDEGSWDLPGVPKAADHI